jgi:hypothetical protein
LESTGRWAILWRIEDGGVDGVVGHSDKHVLFPICGNLPSGIFIAIMTDFL